MSVAENSKFIALVADNGSEFVAQQKANFTINPDIGFVKGRDCYLSFDMLNTAKADVCMAHLEHLLL